MVLESKNIFTWYEMHWQDIDDCDVSTRYSYWAVKAFQQYKEVNNWCILVVILISQLWLQYSYINVEEKNREGISWYDYNSFEEIRRRDHGRIPVCTLLFPFSREIWEKHLSEIN